MQRPPLPPFTHEKAHSPKFRQPKTPGIHATRSASPKPTRPTPNGETATSSFKGRDAIVEFLTGKWSTELHYRLMEELWAYSDNRISVRFEYEWQHAQNGQWYRTHGNEHWAFDEDGYMRRRDMSANDIPISAGDRRI